MVLAQPGDRLLYTYDYGYGYGYEWNHRLVVEQVGGPVEAGALHRWPRCGVAGGQQRHRELGLAPLA